MAKNFAPRVSKRERNVLDMSEKLGKDVFRFSDERLLEGAKLDEIFLKDIVVKDQVRTKFNDSSIKELAKNIEANGLIQPLVLHLKDGKYTLVCGERRYRAMSSIQMEKAPCFILDSKTEQELMAIQFSENSSREALHYIDKADGILNYQIATSASERKIVAALGISKSDVHRSLLIAKLPLNIKEAAKKFNTEKYVLLEYDALEDSTLKKNVEKKILSGELVKRSQFRKILKGGSLLQAGKKTSTALPKGLSAAAFLKAMNAKSREYNLDPEMREMLKSLVDETKEIVDM